MRKSITTLPGILVAAAFSLATISAEAVSFSEKEKTWLDEGKTIRKPLAKSGRNGFFGGAGYTIINAPADAVWAAISDWNSYHRIFPNTVEVREVGRKGDRSLVKMTQGHKLLSVNYHVDIERNKEKRILSFKLNKKRAHDIEETRGYWRLFPQKDGRTLVAYVVAVKVPMGIVNILGDNLTERLGRALLHAPGLLSKWMEGPARSQYLDT